MIPVHLCRDISVSTLCFGTLTVGPLQKSLTPREGGRLIRYALERGINFFDTAELYDTYDHLAAGLQGWSGDVVISSKSYAVDAEEMKKSLELARRKLNRDCIDIFLLHEQESQYTLRGHAGALEYLCQAREKGLVRAVGISTHHVSGVRDAALVDEIDVVHPLINMAGVGIIGGGRSAMEEAINQAYSRGKGIFAMKALAGGTLFRQAAEAFDYVLGLTAVQAVAVGMGCREDVELNVSYFTNREFPQDIPPLERERRLIVEPWCTGCTNCMAACPAGALSLELRKVVVDYSRCLLCGYCVAHCPNFNLKVI